MLENAVVQLFRATKSISELNEREQESGEWTSYNRRKEGRKERKTIEPWRAVVFYRTIAFVLREKRPMQRNAWKIRPNCAYVKVRSFANTCTYIFSRRTIETISIVIFQHYVQRAGKSSCFVRIERKQPEKCPEISTVLDRKIE